MRPSMRAAAGLLVLAAVLLLCLSAGAQEVSAEPDKLAAVRAVAGVGILVMALIQLLKDLLPTRRWWQVGWFGRYFRRAGRDLLTALKAQGGDADEALVRELGRGVDGPYRDLVGLAAAGDRDALFSLPIEKFTGQLAAAAQSALDNPRSHKTLLWLLAKDAAPEDLRAITEHPAPGGTEDEVRALVEARSRVHGQIQRRLDAIQISMGGSWTRFLKWMSFGLGYVLILTSVWKFVPGAIQGPRGWLLWSVLSAVGGFLAPVARDLVAALESFRGRTR
jgi:hypothetical protein